MHERAGCMAAGPRGLIHGVAQSGIMSPCQKDKPLSHWHSTFAFNLSGLVWCAIVTATVTVVNRPNCADFSSRGVVPQIEVIWIKSKVSLYSSRGPKGPGTRRRMGLSSLDFRGMVVDHVASFSAQRFVKCGGL